MFKAVVYTSIFYFTQINTIFQQRDAVPEPSAYAPGMCQGNYLHIILITRP